MKEDALRGWIRRFFTGAPLFLPLLGVVGALLGGQWWALAVLAVVLPHLLRMWRVFICVLLCMGIALLHRSVQDENARLLHEHILAGNHVELVGTVERLLSHGCILDSGPNGVRVVLRGKTPWKVGDKVKVVAVEQESTGAIIPGMFDQKEWLRSQGLAANLSIISGEYLERPFSRLAVLGFAESVRNHMVSRIMPPGTEDDVRRQVLCALTLGDKSRSDYSTLNVFKRGGCLHAFAVSGLHVGIVAGFLYTLAYVLHLGPRARTILVLVIVAGYVLVTGLAVPALRAYLMLALALIGLELRRKVSFLNVWSLAALLILLMSPWQLYNAGFVLSFAVYAAIGLGVKVCMKERPWFAPDEYLPWRLYSPWHDRLRYFDAMLRGCVIVSLAAWLVSAPITVAFFHTLTPWSFLTNLVISPILPWVMGCGLLAVMLSGVPWLGYALQQVSLYLSSLLISTVSFFGELPFAYLPVTEPAEAQSGMVCHLRHDSSCVVLGNPGVVIHCGNESSARFRTEPALFFGGYRPAAVLVNLSSEASAGGVDVLCETWPDIHVIDVNSLTHHLHLHTRAGSFGIYPPPRGIAEQPEANLTPIVHWATESGNVLFIGHAASLSFELLPPELLRTADVVILGYNPDHPIELSMVLDTMRGKTCILLPGTPRAWTDTRTDGAQILQVDEASPVQFISAHP